MSVLLTLRDVGMSFGAQPLFTSISLSVLRGERIGLIGANGSGKSTLLGIMAGIVKPDKGERTQRRMVRLAYLAQDDEFAAGQTAEEAVAEPLHAEGVGGAELHVRVGTALSRAGFADPTVCADTLSGGWRKRLALARALVVEPDVLLLDEPTNHLDLESILWLEKLLGAARFAVVAVSHDRCFLENVTTRTIELGQAYAEGFLSINGPYSVFLEKREELLLGQAGREQSLANRVRREIEWLRRGPKARTTKAKGRIDEAGRLIDELGALKRRNASIGRARIDFTATDRKTRRLIVAEGIARRIGERTLFRDLDIVLSPGVRLGLAGANGSGKTTLLKILAGRDAPDEGSVVQAPTLQVVTFDQNREQLDRDQLLRRALSPHGDAVVYRDQSVHVVSWAKRFLFRPDQLDLPVGVLSGGEQARVLIARLMLRPADVLLLDEPTNDLDIPTLEILEESLLDFPGAVVLISHDRFLLDRVSTVVLGLDGRGGAEVYADYGQWDAARQDMEKEAERERAGGAGDRDSAQAQQPKPRKLSYKEQREWESMEQAIHGAEEALAAAGKAVEDPAVASDGAELQRRLTALDAAQAEVDRLYARWEELGAKQG